MNRQVTLFLALFAMAAFVFSSCTNAGTENDEKANCCQTVNSDSLLALWNNAWNNNDMDALKGMIADSAFVMDHEWYTQGKDSIFALWINPSLTKISNLKTTPLKTTSCCCCVNITGFYSLDYTSQEGIKPAKGNFSFFWLLQEDKSFKLESMLFTEFHDAEKK